MREEKDSIEAASLQSQLSSLQSRPSRRGNDFSIALCKSRCIDHQSPERPLVGSSSVPSKWIRHSPRAWTRESITSALTARTSNSESRKTNMRQQASLLLAPLADISTLVASRSEQMDLLSRLLTTRGDARLTIVRHASHVGTKTISINQN